MLSGFHGVLISENRWLNKDALRGVNVATAVGCLATGHRGMAVLVSVWLSCNVRIWCFALLEARRRAVCPWYFVARDLFGVAVLVGVQLWVPR